MNRKAALLLGSSALAIIALFQNCAQSTLNMASSGESVSPFESNKFQVSEESGSGSEEYASTLSAKTVMEDLEDSTNIHVSVIVDESKRLAKMCTNFGSTYLPVAPPAAEVSAKVLPLYTYVLKLSKSYVFGEMSADVAKDPCILGVSNLTTLVGLANIDAEIEYYNQVYLAPLDTAKSALESALGTSSLAGIKSLFPATINRSRVAILGTGLDISGGEFYNARIPAGSNYVEANSVPQDDHFLGTATAGVLAATGRKQNKVKGLFSDYVELMPIRIYGKGSVSNDDFTHQELRRSIAASRQYIGSMKSLVLEPSIPKDKSDEIWKVINDADQVLNDFANNSDSKFTPAIRTAVSASMKQFYDALDKVEPIVNTFTDAKLKARLQQVIKDVREVKTFKPSEFYLMNLGTFADGANLAIAEFLVGYQENLYSATQKTSLTVQTDLMRSAINDIMWQSFLASLSDPEREMSTQVASNLRKYIAKLNGMIENLHLDVAKTRSILQMAEKVKQETLETILAESVVRTKEMSNRRLADAIIMAVNNGADVISIAAAGATRTCDPILGEAIYQAIRKSVSVVMPAGDDARKLIDVDSVISPACWGPLFKGAIVVGGIETKAKSEGQTKITQFSNIGKEIKILAPATSIPVLGLKNQVSVWNGSVIAQAQVVGAMAVLHSYHKSKNWTYYSPWLLEDLLMDGSQKPNLIEAPNAGVLNFEDLRKSLEGYSTKSEDDRRSLAGAPLALDSIQSGSVTKDTLVIVTNSAFLANGENTQLGVRLLKKNGTQELIAPQAVTWTVSDSKVKISSAGVLTSLEGALGRYQVTAKTQSLTAQATIVVGPARLKMQMAPQAAIVEADLQVYAPYYNINYANKQLNSASINVQLTKLDYIYMYFNFKRSKTESFRQATNPTWTIGPKGKPELQKVVSSTVVLSTYAPGSYELVGTFEDVSRKFSFEIVEPVLSNEVTIEYLFTSVQNGGIYHPRYYDNKLQIGMNTKIEIFPIIRYKGYSSGAHSLPTYETLPVKDFEIVTDLPGLTSLKSGQEFRMPEVQLGPREVTIKYVGPRSELKMADKSTKFVYSVVGKTPSSLNLYNHSDNREPYKWFSVTFYDSSTKDGLYDVDPENFQFSLTDASGEVKAPLFAYRMGPRALYVYIDVQKVRSGTYKLIARHKSGLEAFNSFVHTDSQTKPTYTRVDRPKRPDLNKPPSAICAVEANRKRPTEGAGAGSSTNPYILCTPEQWAASLNRSHYFYQLGDHLDLKNHLNKTLSPWWHLDGDGYSIQNLTFVDDEKEFILLGAHSSVKNLVFVDPMIRSKQIYMFFWGSVKGVSIIGTRRGSAVISGVNISGVNSVSSESHIDRLYLENVDFDLVSGNSGGFLLAQSLSNSVLLNVNIQASLTSLNTGMLLAGTVYNSHLGVNFINPNSSASIFYYDFVDSDWMGSIQSSDSKLKMHSWTNSTIFEAKFKGSLTSSRASSAPPLGIRSRVKNSYFDLRLPQESDLIYLYPYQHAFVLGRYFEDPNPRTVYEQLPLFKNSKDYSLFYFSGNTWSQSLNPHMRESAPYDVDKNTDLPGFVDDPNAGLNQNLAASITSNFVNGRALRPDTKLSIQIGGAKVDAFYYKFIEGKKTGCSIATGYDLTGIAGNSIEATVKDLRLADGTISLCVLGIDTDGLMQPHAKYSAIEWTLDSVAPSAVTISGQPTGPSNADALNVTVTNGGGASHFIYKYGVGTPTFCQDATGARPQPFTSPITQSLKSIPAGPVTLCVWGSDKAGNLSPVTIADWTKYDRAAMADLVGVPKTPSNFKKLNISVKGVGATKYQYKIGPAATTICSEEKDYGASTPIATPITNDLSSFKDGSIRICALAINAAGNRQPLAFATMVEWSSDFSPPTVSIQGAPTGTSADILTDIKISGSDLFAYKYTLGPATKACGSMVAGDWSVNRSAVESIKENLTHLADGELRLCVQAVDAVGNWSETASNITWIKKADCGEIKSGLLKTTTSEKVQPFNCPYGGDQVSVETTKVTQKCVGATLIAEGAPVVTSSTRGSCKLPANCVNPVLNHGQSHNTQESKAVPITCPTGFGAKREITITKFKNTCDNGVYRSEPDPNFERRTEGTCLDCLANSKATCETVANGRSEKTCSAQGFWQPCVKTCNPGHYLDAKGACVKIPENCVNPVLNHGQSHNTQESKSVPVACPSGFGDKTEITITKYKNTCDNGTYRSEPDPNVERRTQGTCLDCLANSKASCETVANGRSEKTCSAQGFWQSCVKTCNVGYTLNASGLCAENPVFVVKETKVTPPARSCDLVALTKAVQDSMREGRATSKALIEYTYCYFYARKPDLTGQGFWRFNVTIDKHESRTEEQLLREISRSLEWKNNNSAAVINNVDFVRRLYATVLARGTKGASVADSEINEWVNHLNRGMTRDEVMRLFVDSAEFRKDFDAAVAASHLPGKGVRSLVDFVFMRILGKTQWQMIADESHGHWCGRVSKGRGATSFSTKHLPVTFASAKEFEVLFMKESSSMSLGATVDLAYQFLLQRKSDAEGRLHWGKFLQSKAGVKSSYTQEDFAKHLIPTMIQSEEFRNKNPWYNDGQAHLDF